MIAIIILVLLWATAMLFRWEIRTHWWAWRLTEVESREDRLYYLARLAAAGDRAIFAADLLREDPRPEIRSMAVTVLEHATCPAADKILLATMSDRDMDVAMAAASVLADHMDQRVFLGILRSRLERRDPQRACVAAAALKGIGGPEAEDALLEALATADDPDLCAQIAESLGLLGCRRAEPLLTALLADERPVTVVPYAQRSALKALRARQGQLREEGWDPRDAMERLSRELTVAAVAAQSLQWIAGDGLTHSATQPASLPVESPPYE